MNDPHKCRTLEHFTFARRGGCCTMAGQGLGYQFYGGRAWKPIQWTCGNGCGMRWFGARKPAIRLKTSQNGSRCHSNGFISFSDVSPTRSEEHTSELQSP